MLPKYYIGYKTVRRDKGDYLGSSKLLLEDIKNIGKNNFMKVIIKRFEFDCDARVFESKLLTHYDARHNELFYNQTNGDEDFVMWPQYGNVMLKGSDRTERQKEGDRRKYTTRSEKRLLADKQHSQTMKNRIKDGKQKKFFEMRDSWRKTEEGAIKWEAFKQKLSVERKGKDKTCDNGRKITSEKLKGNRNSLTGAIRFANMSDEQFECYLTQISQHRNIQQQMRTRRLKGQNFIKTGVWIKHTRGIKYL